MIFFYVDESGTYFGDKRSPYFVLAAVGIAAREYRLADSKVNDLKRRLVSWAKPEDFEIKGRDIRHGLKLFSGLDWPIRVRAIHEIAQLIAELPCDIFVVQMNKRRLPEGIGSDDMYRLALWRLLEVIDLELVVTSQYGMMMVDARSTLHTAVQDRRLIDAYRDWVSNRRGQVQLLELPWFGFSAFYVGLQLADFSAYIVDFVSNEHKPGREDTELFNAYDKFKYKVKLVRVP